MIKTTYICDSCGEIVDKLIPVSFRFDESQEMYRYPYMVICERNSERSLRGGVCCNCLRRLHDEFKARFQKFIYTDNRNKL